MASNHPVNHPSSTPAALDLDIGLPVFDPRTASVSNSALAANVDPPVTDFVILLDPHSVRIPDTPNRTESAFENEKFEELRQGIRAKGRNLQPIMVRWVAESEGVPATGNSCWASGGYVHVETLACPCARSRQRQNHRRRTTSIASAKTGVGPTFLHGSFVCRCDTRSTGPRG